jgi:hypothetical protein
MNLYETQHALLEEGAALGFLLRLPTGRDLASCHDFGSVNPGQSPPLSPSRGGGSALGSFEPGQKPPPSPKAPSEPPKMPTAAAAAAAAGLWDETTGVDLLEVSACVALPLLLRPCSPRAFQLFSLESIDDRRCLTRASISRSLAP